MEFRTPQSTPARRSNDESAPVTPVQKAAPSYSPRPEKKKRKLSLKIIVATVLIVVLLIGGFMAYKSLTPTYISGGKYQAVFFTNGQVYFGKLQRLDDGYLRLTKVFYLQSKTATTTDSKNPQDAATKDNSDVELIKLGSEIHAPEDEMVVNRSQVLFFENLKPGGSVSGSITKYYAKPQ